MTGHLHKAIASAGVDTTAVVRRLLLGAAADADRDESPKSVIYLGAACLLLDGDDVPIRRAIASVTDVVVCDVLAEFSRMADQFRGLPRALVVAISSLALAMWDERLSFERELGNTIGVPEEWL